MKQHQIDLKTGKWLGTSKTVPDTAPISRGWVVSASDPLPGQRWGGARGWIGEPVVTESEAEKRCSALNVARDELTGKSPLDVPGIGVFDYDQKSREKLAVAQRFLAAMDQLDPANSPHSTPWTLSDNSQISLDSVSFAQIDIASAARGYALHQACLRAKAAIRSGVDPDPADTEALRWP